MLPLVQNTAVSAIIKPSKNIYYIILIFQSYPNFTFLGPNSQSSVSNGYHSLNDNDIVQPQGLEDVIAFMLKILETNLRDDNGKHILLGDQFTLAGAKLYCESLGGHLYEPKSTFDLDFLYHIASKYDLSEIWIGVYGRGTYPRNINNWNYYSNRSQILPEVIFEKIDQDNGVSFVGKSE